ncbi:type II toxin-antitoxin system VapC family toxin [candidate division KSB1 bacterium]|nr:type II toxin-antitoxin system VapC family toxin [candidate division KSB1 bacterium]
MIALDTHAWFFWVNDSLDELSSKALESIQSEDTLGVSIISCWEIAMLVAKDRLRLNIDVQSWIDQALKYPGVKLLNLNPEITVLSTRLPGKFHGDPADRLIVATCMQNNISLISKDKKIHSWGNINVIW